MTSTSTSSSIKTPTISTNIGSATHRNTSRTNTNISNNNTYLCRQTALVLTQA
jgi:hypothetical protein